MANMTFILGMERFNDHVWADVERRLVAGGVQTTIKRFHDGHVESRDEALIAAIHDADVVFITLVNQRDRADWLAAQLAESRAQTVFVFESMPEAMALNRVGDYRVKGGTSSLPKPMRMVLNLISKGREEDTLYAYTKLTKISSKLLPLMPAKLKDFRTWLSTNIYWNQPDAANISEMVKLILRDCCGQSLNVAPVRPIPMMGCFHPDADAFFEGPQAFLKWNAKRGSQKNAKTQNSKLKPQTSPLVAVLAFRKHVVQEQKYLGDLIHALEAKGLQVLPVFCSGIEAHVAVREWLPNHHIDLIINTMGFPIVGGPAGSTKPGHYHEKAGDLLAGLDVPYMIVQPLQMQSEQEWHERGAAPMQAVIMYDLPEMDGAIAPVVLGAIRDGEIVAAPDRLERAATLAASFAHLRHTPRRERKLAFVLYNYPPGLGKLGTAALLDVPASLHGILAKLKAEGYTIDVPETVAALTEQISKLDSNTFSAPSVPFEVKRADYYRTVAPELATRVEKHWGAFPGDLAPTGRESVRIDGMALGNAFVGIQPPMGVPGDPMRLLFERDFTPHHQYISFYRYLSDVWQADAIVHVGMHGTSEWMPGLQLGLTGDCWPDALLGSVPNFYLYPLNNPSEAAIARRRGYATTISHAVPPYARAGLYKQLSVVRSQLSVVHEQLDTDESGAVQALHNLQLPELLMQPDEQPAVYISRLSAYLDELEQRLIVDGLHTFGENATVERAQALVEAALDIPRAGQPGLSALLKAEGATDVPTARAEFITNNILANHESHNPQHTAFIAQGRSLLANMAASDETGALVHALDGGYIRAAHGADPVRAGASAFPSGRNIHGIDPWRLPSDAALERGRQMAALLLARHVGDGHAHDAGDGRDTGGRDDGVGRDTGVRPKHLLLAVPYTALPEANASALQHTGAGQHMGAGRTPETIALTLWAMDTIKTEGESLAVVLALVGAQPERDGQGKIWRFDLIPLAELGRPRVDVLLDISPIFRDTFQMSLDLLDDMFRRAAAADELPEWNAVRAHALTMQHDGRSWDEATARIFTQAPGRYGTGVDELIDEGQWEANDDLAEMYTRRGAHAYGGTRGGAAVPEVLHAMLGTVDHVFQAIDSVEYGVTDISHYYGHGGAIQLAASKVRGERVPLTYAESYTGSIKIAGAEELIQLETRAKLLNPRWYEGMLAHGFAGAAEIGTRFTHLLGWGAVSGNVPNWVFDDAAATFVLDDVMRERLEQANPQAARNAVARLLEASGRGLWQTDAATLDRLQALYGDLEDRLEGVAH